MIPRVAVGIDPGKDGGVAVVELDSRAFAWAASLPYFADDDCPDGEALRRIVGARGPVDVVACGVELVGGWAMPGPSAFVFGLGVGVLLEACRCAGWPVVRVAPAAWQKTIGCTGKARKEAARRKKATEVAAAGPVSRLFPGVDLRLGRRVNPHSGMVDALAIAEHVRRGAVALPFG